MFANRRKLLIDAGFLYCAHFLRYLFPVLILPFLARALGPDRYGVLFISLSVAGLVGIIVEFGFNVSATRDLAAASRDKRSQVVSAIVSAKLFLALIGLLIGTVAIVSVDALRHEPSLGACAVLLGVVQGASFSWYFRGTDRMAIAVVIELAIQIINLGLLFALVSGPQDVVLVLVAQIAAGVAVQSAAAVAVLRETSVRVTSLRRTLQALVDGFPIFLQYATWATYATASGLVLGWLSTPEQVGYFGSADKFTNAALQLMNPLLALMLPHVTRNFASEAHNPIWVLRTTVGTLIVLALVLTGLNAVGGPRVASLVLGSSFDKAGPVLVVLGFILPFCAASQSLAMLFFIPTRNDATLNRVLLLGALVNLSSALVLAPTYGAIGMALSRVLAEMAVTMAMFLRMPRVLSQVFPRETSQYGVS